MAVIPPLSFGQLKLGDRFTAHPDHPLYNENSYKRVLTKVDRYSAVDQDDRPVAIEPSDDPVWLRVGNEAEAELDQVFLAAAADKAAQMTAREILHHKVNGLNDSLTVECLDQPSHGGACHHYRIMTVGEHQGREGYHFYLRAPLIALPYGVQL